ncbi:hypothetical protein N7488_001337 [Penicillium malachiteum]|nr:hypothetical protein N7488_001337 [Penicillium malachiteum]
MILESRSNSTLSQAYLDADIGDRLTGVAAAMLPITLFFLALRFYSRSLTRTPWGLDDALAGAAGFVAVGLSALAICFVKDGGVGRHLEALAMETPSREPKYFIWLLVVSTYYYSTVAIPKLAVLALYGRLWTVNPYRSIILILAAVITLTAVVSGIMCLNMCRPFKANWDTSIGTCYNKQAFFLWASLPNIITDLIMLAMPVPIVWNLNVTMKVKLGLILTFATGILGLITSIMRFIIFAEGNAVQDGSWSSTDLMAWSVAEPDIYLISACLPTFRPLLTRIFGREGSTANSNSQHANRYGGTGPSAANNSKENNTALESALYGDEVGLVSFIGKQSNKSEEERIGDDGIYVSREVNVQVSNH